MPSYSAYVQRSRVPVGLDALAAYMTRMEQRYQDVGNYANGANCAVALPTAANFTVTCALTNGTQGFTATATGNGPLAGYAYTITHNGVRATTAHPEGRAGRQLLEYTGQAHATDETAHGLTLVELMVGIGIAAILMMASAPFFGDYIRNSRLREAGNALLSEALFAQSEAIKLNATVRLSTSGATVQVIDRTDPLAEVVLRERTLAGNVTAPVATIDYGSEGRPLPFGTVGVDRSFNDRRDLLRRRPLPWPACRRRGRHKAMHKPSGLGELPMKPRIHRPMPSYRWRAARGVGLLDAHDRDGHPGLRHAGHDPAAGAHGVAGQRNPIAHGRRCGWPMNC